MITIIIVNYKYVESISSIKSKNDQCIPNEAILMVCVKY